MGNAVVHFEIMGKDAKQLQSFYSDLFGWKINADNPMNYGVVDRESNVNKDGVGIGGGVGSNPQGSSVVTVYIEADDVQAALDKAESLGATVVMPPSDVMEGVHIALFNDPAGNTIGLYKSQ